LYSVYYINCVTTSSLTSSGDGQFYNSKLAGKNYSPPKALQHHIAIKYEMKDLINNPKRRFLYSNIHIGFKLKHMYILNINFPLQ